MLLEVKVDQHSTTARISCYQSSEPLPRWLGRMEMVFLTSLARLATRHKITPERVVLEELPKAIEPYRAYFGCEVLAGDVNEVVFMAEDAERPFMTENNQMWSCFEPDLKRRLSELDFEAGMAQRVKSALLEMLPSGQSTMEQVARRLAMSKRTLQRRLSDESETFQSVLQLTRRELAQHYLHQPDMSQGEISFLLGFQDTNSFIRAYNSWTGHSPGQFRGRHVQTVS